MLHSYVPMVRPWKFYGIRMAVDDDRDDFQVEKSGRASIRRRIAEDET